MCCTARWAHGVRGGSPGISAWKPGLRVLAAATWILATPALNYALADLWPSHFYGWSLLPWMVLFLRRILDDAGPTQPWRQTLTLHLVLGLFGVNGHFGQVPILVLPMALMCACEPRSTVRRLPTLLTAAAIGTCIAAPAVVRLLQEIQLFPDLPRNTVEVPIGARALAGLVLRPLIDVQPDGSLDPGDYGAQTPFFGGPMFLLALAAIAGAARERPLSPGTGRGVRRLVGRAVLAPGTRPASWRCLAATASGIP